MCPVKYAGEWRTISWAAERAHSLASGTITSGDFRFVTASLLLFPCVFSLSVFFLSLPFCHFSLSLAVLFPLSHSRDKAITILPDRYSLPVCTCVHTLTCLCFSSTCAPYGVLFCICACVRPSVGMWRVWRLSPNGAAALWVEQCNDSCLLALHHLYVHRCLHTRCVCLAFLNGPPPTHNGNTPGFPQMHSKERQREEEEEERCYCGGGGDEMQDIEGERDAGRWAGGAEKILMGALEDLLSLHFPSELREAVGDMAPSHMLKRSVICESSTGWVGLEEIQIKSNICFLTFCMAAAWCCQCHGHLSKACLGSVRGLWDAQICCQKQWPLVWIRCSRRIL